MNNLELDSSTVEIQQSQKLIINDGVEEIKENRCSENALDDVAFNSPNIIEEEQIEKSKNEHFDLEPRNKHSISSNISLNEVKSPIILSNNVSNEIAEILRADNIPHVFSEPILTSQLQQTEHQQKIKSYQNTKQSAIWQIESSDNKNSSALSSLNTIRKTSGAVNYLPRRVSFPKSDSELVTGYLEPADPWKHVSLVNSISEITELYILSCTKHKTVPLKSILQHLKVIELNKELRQPLLSLSGTKLNSGDCEALEEIFKRVQYKSIDLSGCELDEISASALFEMIEYYEAANELNIASNPKGMTYRGWISCSYMISHSQALHTLNAQANPLSKSSAENLGHALSSSNLHTLKLEHCGLKGTPLSGLCFKLRHNKTLRELWLAYNDLDCYDADTIGELLKVNHFLELVDISNNNIKNVGLEYIIKALVIQSHELQRRSMLHRSAAIDSDEIGYPNEVTKAVTTHDSHIESDNKSSYPDNTNQMSNDPSNLNVTKDNLSFPNIQSIENLPFHDSGNFNNTDDSKRLQSKSTSHNNGQSMLDKLLSMKTDNYTAGALRYDNFNKDEDTENSNQHLESHLKSCSNNLVSSNENIQNANIENNKQTHLLNHTEADDFNVDALDTLKENDKKYEGIKNNRGADDCDDAYSTDSAFESASEGDISRNLPEDYKRYTNLNECSEIDEAVNGLTNEKDTLASDMTECFIETSSPVSKISAPSTASICNNTDSKTTNLVLIPKVTLEEGSIVERSSDNISSLSLTPPPPSSSPGKTIIGIHRIDSNCSPLTQAARNRSQSSDSLCSDTSLDGSLSSELNFSTSAQLNEKITKNDTLTRQIRHSEITNEISYRPPGGLKALVVWNNQLTKESASCVSNLLTETVSLELLNIGKNCLSNDFIYNIKEGLKKNTTVTTLGLQSAHISEKGIEELSAALCFGGNSTLQRIDIRDNKLEVQSLTTIAEALKSNNCVTQIDLDDVPKRLSAGSEEHLDYSRVLELVRSMCARNERANSHYNLEKSTNNNMGKVKNKSGYYLGSRKISLTMASRPIIDSQAPFVVGNTNAMSKLDVKRRNSTRLRSPVPSPPTISPSSSPNRSRFQVFRVHEVSPLTSPSIQIPPHGLITQEVNDIGCATNKVSSLSCSLEKQEPHQIPAVPSPLNLPISCSLPSIATITSSTQSVKRPAMSSRSRFHVSKIYEDPLVPMAKRSLPPITPPIIPPPTPIAKASPEEIEMHTKNVPDLIVDDNSKSNIVTSKEDNYINLNTSSNISVKEKNSGFISTSSSCISTFSNLISPLSSSSSSSSTETPALFNLNTISSSKQDDLTEGTESTDNIINSENLPLENDATLTQSSGKDVLLNEIATGNHVNGEQHESCSATSLDTLGSKLSQQKARKVSSTTTVEKLLTIFQNPSTLFQRSCSPEPKSTLPSFLLNQENVTNIVLNAAALEEHDSRAATGSKWQKPEDNEQASTATTNITNVDQSRSFLDAATKQFRDLGKQVFSFGQEFEPSTSDHIAPVQNNARNHEQSKPLDNSAKSTQEQEISLIGQYEDG